MSLNSEHMQNGSGQSKPDAIVHTGFNKCGSTAIQDWLRRERGTLARHGFMHHHTDPLADVICSNPQFAVLGHTLAGELAPLWALNAILGFETGDKTAQHIAAHAFKDRFEQSVTENADQTHVISSEYLAGRLFTGPAIAALSAWLSSIFASVTYVAYVRTPPAWLLSLYGQSAREGKRGESLDAFLNRLANVPFARVLRDWTAAAESACVNVRLFKQSWLSGTGLIDDFAAAIGYDAQPTGKRTALVNTNNSRSTLRSRIGRLLHPRSPRTSERLVLDQAAQARILAANEHDLNWIKTEFFSDKTDEFDSWAKAPSFT